MEKKYNVVIIYFDKHGTYSHTLKIVKEEAYDAIEHWSRIQAGMCQIVDMHKVLEHLKSLNK